MGFGDGDFGVGPFGTTDDSDDDINLPENRSWGFGNEPFGEAEFGGEDSDDTFFSDHSNPPKDGTPRDLALNQRQDIFFAANGDLAVVNGRDNIKQSAAIDVLHTTTPSIGGTVKPSTLNRVLCCITTVNCGTRVGHHDGSLRIVVLGALW